TLREVRHANGTCYVVLDLPIVVPVPEPASWASVERVVGAEWGVHTLLTATTIDTHERQVGGLSSSTLVVSLAARHARAARLTTSKPNATASKLQPRIRGARQRPNPP